EAADLRGAVQLHAPFLEPPDAEHALEQVRPVPGVRPPGRRRTGTLTPLGLRGPPAGLGGRRGLAGTGGGAGRAHADPSRVDTSPVGRPSSRARSTRRTTLPLRVLGRFWSN